MLLNCGVGENSCVPWTARRSNQSILKEISPEYSLEGLILKLKLQYFVHLMWRTDSFEQPLMLEKIEGGKRRGRQRMSWLDGITNLMAMSLCKLQELAETYVHWFGHAIQLSHPLLSLSPTAFTISQHQNLFQWVSSLYQMAKILEFQLQYQSFQWIFRTDFL